MNIKKTLLYLVIAGLFATLFTPLLVSGGLFFPYITGKAFFFRVVVEIIAGLWVVLALVDKSYAPKKSWIFYAVSFFAVITLIADIFGENPYKAFWSNYERMEGWVTIAHLFLYFLVVGAVLVKEKLWERFFQTSIAVSVITCFFAISQLFKNGLSYRADGPLGNPIYLAVYLLIHIFILLFFIFKDEKKIFQNPIHYLYTLVIIFEGIILYFTQTRGTVAGLFVGFLVTALCVAIAERKNRTLQYSAIGIIAFLVLVSATFYGIRNTSFVQHNAILSRFASVFTELEKITNPGDKKIARYYVWDMAIQGVKEHPVLGWGQEGFNLVFNKYYDPNMYDQEQWFDRTHDVFFDWLVAGGILGLLSYLSLFGAILYYLWRPKGNQIFSLTEKAIFTGLLVGYFVHNIFVFDNLTSYILFFVLLAYIHTRVTESDSSILCSYKTVDEETLKWVVIPIVAVVLIGSVYYVNWRPYVAASTLVQAMQPKYATSSSVTGARLLDPMQNLSLYKKALSYHSLGDSEIRENLMQTALSFARPEVPRPIQDAFLTLAKTELDNQLEISPQDTRYLLFTASLLDSYGQYDTALTYFKRAQESSPTKQTILFAFINNAISRKSYVEALSLAKFAFEEQKSFDTARIIYASTLILNREFKMASDILTERFGTSLLYNDQIINAYNVVGQWKVSIQILKSYLSGNPDDAQARLSLASTYVAMGDKASAIKELLSMEKDFPEYKSQLDGYLQSISK